MQKNTRINNSIFESFGHAFDGIKHVFRHERNFRLHVISSIFALVLAYLFNCDLIELALLIIVMAMVLVSEMINSAIEYTWDKLEPNHHPVVGVIKDAMSGAVLITAISALLVGIIIVIRHVLLIF